jgi:hypothetical protein
MRRLAALTVSVLLSGCWQSKVDFYANVPSARPFHPGKVASQSSAGEQTHAVLSLERGRYRLTNDDRADSDFGDSFILRFIPLTGAPPDIWVFDAQDACKPGDASCKTQQHYYGLVRLTPQGAEVRNPDCPKAALLGARPDNFGACDFSSRALLEKALAALARAAWKPDIMYRYD